MLWSYATGGMCDSSPAVANGVVYVGSGDDNVYALNASTGAMLWRYPTGGFVYSSPAVANGVVYVGSEDGNVYALKPAPAPSCGATPPAAMCSPRPQWRRGSLCRLERQQRVRAERQHRRPAVELRHRRAGVFLARGGEWGGLYRLGRHNVYALNANTGGLLWSYTTTGHIPQSSPAVVNGVVYIGSNDGEGYAFGLQGLSETGSEASRPEDPSPRLQPQGAQSAASLIGAAQRLKVN